MRAQMSRQEVFTKVSEHLMSQMARSSGASGGCWYRGTHGRKCAIGCLIEDQDYRPDFEGKSVSLLPLRGLGLYEAGLDLLEELQHVHDGAEPRAWFGRLGRLGRKFGLDLPKCLGGNGSAPTRGGSS